jgi:hypothetical protein
MQFQIVSIQHCWGEARVRYRDEKGALRTVPITWTDHKPYDMFLEQSAGRSIVHIKDLSGLMQLMSSLQDKIQEKGGVSVPKEV